MQSRQANPPRRLVSIGVLGSIVCLAGFVLMSLASDNWWLRQSYDGLHFWSSKSIKSRDAGVAVIEVTGTPPAGSRSNFKMQTQLLSALRRAGVSCICYTVPFSEAGEGEMEFADEIAKKEDVVLGGYVKEVRNDGQAIRHELVKPIDSLLKAARGACGSFDIDDRDRDDIWRHFDLQHEGIPVLAALAAARIPPEDQNKIPDGRFLLNYEILQGGITYMDANKLIEPGEKTQPFQYDGKLMGKTIFIGRRDPAAIRSEELFQPPNLGLDKRWVSRATMHAVAYSNLLSGTWFREAGWVRNLIWASVFPIAFALILVLVPWGWRTITIVSGIAALVLAVVCIYIIWETHVLINWTVLPLAQLPIGLVGIKFLPYIPMRTDRAQVFISAATDEFAEHRKVLMLWLKHSFEIYAQAEPDKQGGLAPIADPTLIALDDYIRDVSCVVHLVGEMPGKAASEKAVLALKERHPKIMKLLGKLYAASSHFPSLAYQEWEAALSYTQWEAYLADFHGKSLLIGIQVSDINIKLSDALPCNEQQREHVKRLAAVKRYGAFVFTNVDNLTVAVQSHLLHAVIRGSRTLRR
jgi:hypothetical protein